MITDENLCIVRFQLFTNMLLFVYIRFNLKNQYLDVTNLINGKKVFGPSQIFAKLELIFEL
jgi:hypothetical protein